MKATIKAGALASALAVHGGNSRGTVQALRYARIDATAGTIQTTDMERMATRRVSMSGGGVFLLPIEQARGFASRMDANAEIAIVVDDGSAKLTCGRSRATMEVLDPDDFPILTAKFDDAGFAIDAAAFASMIGKVDAFVSDEETRYYLCGVFLEARDGHLIVTATHGHVLATYKAPIDFAGNCKAIIPTATLAVVKKITAGKMNISVANNLIQFATAETSLLSKVIDGDFPDYERVIVKAGANVEFKAGAMSAAIALVAASSDDDRHDVRLSISEDRLVVAGVHGKSIASTDVDCAAESDAQIEIACNYRYLADAIKSVSDGVILTVSDPLTPMGVFDADDPGLRVTVMPVRV